MFLVNGTNNNNNLGYKFFSKKLCLINKNNTMRKISIAVALVALIIIVIIGSLKQKDQPLSPKMQLSEKFSQKDQPKVDHTKFDILKQTFNSPQEVTKACETCHNMTAHEVMNSNHWNWERVDYIKGRGITYIGKRNAINNFCISAVSNELACAKCHIGYGIDETGRGFTDSTNIDCLVCHDQTETYVKADNMAGKPKEGVNLNFVAQNVGRPNRTNCGVCHFYGGGGNNVKHGDLEMAMFEPTKSLDIHMGTDGMNMACVDCHKTKHHNISGKLYSLSSMNVNRAYCEDCHTSTPHEKEILNEHPMKVACQTCHIPTYAKANSTKMYWDWSQAGKLKDGKPYTIEDSLGNHVYMSIKGAFVWARDVKPDYIWFNGTSSHYVAGDVVEDTTKTLILNKLHGSYNDPESKIIPVKIHLAKQPFDPVNKILIQPKLYSPNPGEGAYWKDFDWVRASESGMKTVGLPFSGKVSFIETAMYWPVNHMVAPKEQTVQCKECHTRQNSRIAKLTDFYIPGRDRSDIVEYAGFTMIILTIFGVLVHAFLRYYFKPKL